MAIFLDECFDYPQPYVNFQQESQGAYGTADKMSIKLKVNRWYTVQSNGIRKCIST